MDRSGSRGQLILVAGVGIAVTFVALALVLNTVIYTENLATRQQVDGQETIVYERAAEDGVGGLVSQLNYYDYETYKGLHGALNRSASAWANQSMRDRSSRGTAVSVDVVRATNGSHIVQESTRNFTSAGGSGAWKLAEGVNETRRFRMNVSRDSLASYGLTDALLGSDVFNVTVTGTSGDAWNLFIYRNSTTDVVVETIRPDGTHQTCVVTSAPSQVSIDVTGGTVEGTECDALAPFRAGTTAPYGITFEDGTNIKGRYTLFVDKPLGPLRDGPYSGTVGNDPYAVRAIYDATVNLTVRDGQLTYESTVEVAPERPPDGETYGVYVPTREAVYVSASTNLLSSVHPDGTITRYDNASGVQTIGPKQFDFDNDGLKEVPYVNSSGVLKTIDANNQTQVLATGAATSKSLLGVGLWRGKLSVYYVNATDNGHIYRVNWTSGTAEAPSKVLAGGNGVAASAVAGVGDYNDNGNADLIYTGTSQGVYYIEGDNTVSVGRGVGQNNGIGIGAPRQHDGNGLIRVPMVDGSANVGLLNYQNEKTSLTSSGPSAKAPVAGVNWVGGAAREVVFIDAGTGELYYVTLGGSIERLRTDDGPVKVVVGPGVA